MEKSFLDRLSDKVWKTKIARFEASRQMKRNRYASNTVMTLASAFIIVINLLVFTKPFSSTKANTAITVLTISLSVITLVVTLLVNQLDYEKKEHIFHDCATELDSFNQELRILIEEKIKLSLDEKKCYVRRYYDIIRKYDLNHDEIDYEYAMCNVTEENYTFLNSLLIVFRRYILSMHAIYYLLGLVMLVVCACILMEIKSSC